MAKNKDKDKKPKAEDPKPKVEEPKPKAEEPKPGRENWDEYMYVVAKGRSLCVSSQVKTEGMPVTAGDLCPKDPDGVGCDMLEHHYELGNIVDAE